MALPTQRFSWNKGYDKVVSKFVKTTPLQYGAKLVGS